MTTQFTPVEDASSFRRMAAAMWRSPRDPSIYGSMDVDATDALAFLARHEAETGVRLTVTHLVARAVAAALRAQPEINGKVRFWDKLEQRRSIDVFVTSRPVAISPGAHRRRRREIARRDRARDRRPRRQDPQHRASYQKSRSLLKAVPWWLARPATWLSDMLVNELHVDLPARHAARSVRFGDRDERRHVRYRCRVRAVRAARALPDVDPRARGAAAAVGRR